MQLKFEGRTHSIDANTLMNILLHYQNVVQEANRIYGGGTHEVKLQVNAIERGSFVIDLELVQGIVQQLFSKDTAGYIADLTGIVGFCYGAYHALKGHPAKTEEEKRRLGPLIVKGDINTYVTIYNSRETREAISKSIQTADEDASVEGLTVTDKEGNALASFRRDDFKAYQYEDFEAEDEMPDERIVDTEATLVIVGLSFEPGTRWQFMYDGFKIPITVKDDALMRRIDAGERFGKGDAIRVMLRKVQRYNKNYRTYENRRYKIVEFYEHIVPPKQQTMF